MITIQIFNQNNTVCGYEISGHAGYSQAGQDIVCAAVSVLSINTANAIERFTDIEANIHVDDTGYLKVLLPDKRDVKAQVLLDAFSLGIQEIYNNYGKTYIHVEFKEV